MGDKYEDTIWKIPATMSSLSDAKATQAAMKSPASIGANVAFISLPTSQGK